MGVPTVADRVAQTVAAMTLEHRTESIFHDDSFGYRPRRSALDAVAKCRKRCWSKDWVIDLDVAKFFDSVPWDLMVKAVAANITTEQRWVLVYVKRWLAAPIQQSDGTLVERNRGTPQGSAASPVLVNCSCTTRSIRGSKESSRQSNSSVTPMMRWCTARPSGRHGQCWPHALLLLGSLPVDRCAGHGGFALLWIHAPARSAGADRCVAVAGSAAVKKAYSLGGTQISRRSASNVAAGHRTSGATTTIPSNWWVLSQEWMAGVSMLGRQITAYSQLNSASPAAR